MLDKPVNITVTKLDSYFQIFRPFKAISFTVNQTKNLTDLRLDSDKSLFYTYNMRNNIF